MEAVKANPILDKDLIFFKCIIRLGDSSSCYMVLYNNMFM